MPVAYQIILRFLQAEVLPTVKLVNIHSLTGFPRDDKTHLERLAATGRPEALTVNGKARVVVQDAAPYQKMPDALDEVETERVVRTRLDAMERGEPEIPADRVLAAVRTRLGVKRT